MKTEENINEASKIPVNRQIEILQESEEIQSAVRLMIAAFRFANLEDHISYSYVESGETFHLNFTRNQESLIEQNKRLQRELEHANQFKAAENNITDEQINDAFDDFYEYYELEEGPTTKFLDRHNFMKALKSLIAPPTTQPQSNNENDKGEVLP